MKDGVVMSNEFKNAQTATPKKGYQVGESDYSRGWGGYEVTRVVYEDNDPAKNCLVCEKDITVNPAQALSLQSHDQRRELWVVTKGTLTVVLDGQKLTLNAGEEVRIPVGGIHCMANLGTAPCVVHEVQEGVCDEDDIHRFKDMYGRPAEQSNAPNVVSSLKVYDEILRDIGFSPAASAPIVKP